MTVLLILSVLLAASLVGRLIEAINDEPFPKNPTFGQEHYHGGRWYRYNGYDWFVIYGREM